MNADIKYKRISFRFLIISVLLSVGCYKTSAQSYGLIFSSHEVVPEKRTSLDLTNNTPVCFSDRLDLSFDLSFVPNYTTYFGYVFRLVNNKGQNIDLIYDQKKENFTIVFCETFTDISFKIDKSVLMSEWSKLRFSVDLNKGITCYYNSKIWQTKKLNLSDNCFKVLFGASNEHNFISRDVPPMKIKNISIQVDGDKRSFWPLNESAGENATDSVNQLQAKIINPVWIKPQHAIWENLAGFKIQGRPSVAFNSNEEELYIVSVDSFYTISAKNSKITVTSLSVAHNNLLAGNQSVFNKQSNKLYNFYTDQKSVTEYDFNNKRWNHNFDTGNLTEFWQVNKFLSGDSNLFIIGGYGQLKYKNSVQRYSFATKKWDILTPAGDFFAPRYLAALGSTVSGDTAYIIGGYGSKEGDQLLSPRYFYDLLMYDAKQNRFKKIYTLPQPEQQFVFANSIIIDKNNNDYYGLIFPNDRFNDSLQLIKGSLTKPEYALLGKPFPYSFNDVRSFADLYYCEKSKLLIAVTLYTSNDNITEAKVYTIHFPPNQLNDLADKQLIGTAKTPSFNLLYAILFTGLVILVAVYFIYRKHRLKKQELLLSDKAGEPAGEPGVPKPVYAPNTMPATEKSLFPETGLDQNDAKEGAFDYDSALYNNPGILPGREGVLPISKSRIMLFGYFEVITSDGNNITRQFTPLLKEMFLLILIDSLRYNKGVSSEKLNDILWKGKEIKDAKNNRSVNLVKVKNILDKLGGCTISRETGAWKFEYNSTLVYIDLLEYLNLFTDKDAVVTSIQADKLLNLLRTGAFLQETHYDWLDSIKAEISNSVIETLLRYSESVNIDTETEKMISICNAIFCFDELNEHALKLKCKCLIALGNHTLAKNTFTKFALKYNEIYGEDFGESYQSLITN